MIPEIKLLAENFTGKAWNKKNKLVSLKYYLAIQTLKVRSYYGGTSVILPLELDVFMKMVENSYGARFVPTPQHIKELFDFSKQAAETAANEVQWYTSVQDKAMQWLVA